MKVALTIISAQEPTPLPPLSGGRKSGSVPTSRGAFAGMTTSGVLMGGFQTRPYIMISYDLIYGL